MTVNGQVSRLIIFVCQEILMNNSFEEETEKEKRKTVEVRRMKWEQQHHSKRPV
jgi:hypothetical protein